MATIDDIQARADRLFRESPEYGDPLQIRLKGQTDQQAPPKPADQAGVTSRTRRKSTSNKNLSSRYNRSIPPYAKNPHRVSTLADVEARSRRLFELHHDPGLDPVKVRQIKHKLIDVNRSASTVASYFVRQADENKLLPAQRRAVAQVDKQYFELRRFIFNDTRLSRHDKAQLVSVLTFERVKAREAIKETLSPNWSNYMSSAAIRNLMAEKDDRKAPEYSITGANPDPQTPIRDRVQRLVRNLTLATDSDLDEEQKRELSAKDIYTRRSKITQAVHYLDKTTDKTLFIDTGKAIALRKNGITEAGVTVALQLAQQRFGSTLTVNGSAEFKRLCVEAVAKGEMDIHFTDRKMNQALAERRAELALEREGQNIGTPEAEAEITGAEEATAEASEASEPEDPTAIRGELVAHGQAPYQNNPKNKGSYYVTLNTERGPRTLWGVELERVMTDGEFKIGQGIKLKDHGPEPVKIPVRGADGQMTTKDGYRRVWSASELAPTSQQKEASKEGVPLATAAPAPIKLVYKGQPVTLELPKREEMARAEVPENKSMLVNMHENRLNQLKGVELELLMSSDIVASDWADYDAALVVATSDTTKEGLDHVLEMMKFENYRAAFEKSAWEYFESAPFQFQADAAVGWETAKRLMNSAEAHYGPAGMQAATDTVIAPVAAPATDTVIAPVARSTTDTVIAPVAAPATDTVIAPVAASATDTVIAPVARSTTDTVIAPVAAPATDTVIAPVNARPATDRLASVQATINSWLSDGNEAEKAGDKSRAETSAQMVTKYEERLADLAYEVGTKAEPVDWSNVATNSAAAIAEYARGLQFALDNPYAAADMVSKVLDATEKFITSGFGQSHPLDLSRFRETDVETWIESGVVELNTDEGPQRM